jgi:hypothetical protein
MEYSKYRKEQLVELCLKHNLSASGNKNELIERLLAADRTKASQLSLTKEPALDFVRSEISTRYIHLKGSNLAHYFNFGVIYPLALEESEIYRTENRKNDILTTFQEYIVICDRPINDFANDDVLVEIVTNDLLINNLSSTDLSYIPQPIAISRIKRILFKSQVEKVTFISSVKTFPDSFIPETICSIIDAKVEPYRIDLSTITLPPNIELHQWALKLDRFDKILGMLGYMKNVGIFYAENENIFQEYTPTYLTALSIINSAIRPIEQRDAGLFKYILFPMDIGITSVQRLLFRQIQDTIFNNEIFSVEKAIDIIQKTIAASKPNTDEIAELKTIELLFEDLLMMRVPYKELLLNETVRRHYPIIALLFLAKFPNKGRQHTDKQAVRNIFISHEANFSKNIVEFVLAVLGLYYGYKSMIKQDTNLRFTDPYYKVLADQFQSIKYRLDNDFDRLTIESVFDFCDSGNTINSEYKYLNGYNGLIAFPNAGKSNFEYKISYNKVIGY